MRLLKLVPDDTNIGFLKWRNIAMAFSILTIIASIGLVASKGLNFGVDFIGGQMIQATFTGTALADSAMAKRRSSDLAMPTKYRFGCGCRPRRNRVRKPLLK